VTSLFTPFVLQDSATVSLEYERALAVSVEKKMIST
jgi:hypothetical protein